MEKSAAFVLGYLSATPMPSEEAFQKVASAVQLDPELVRAVYVKQALHPLWGMAAAASIPLLAMPAMDAVKKTYRRWKHPGIYDQTQNMGLIGGMNPREESELGKHVVKETMKNQQLSRNLQLLGGMYRPAPNPWGGAPGITTAGM